MMTKIFHTADWHIKEPDIEEARKCLEFLVAKAIEHQPDIIVIAGDIFDVRGVKMESQSAQLCVKIVSHLADVAPVVGVLGTKSHDGEAPVILANVRARHQIIIAASPMQVFFSAGADKKYLSFTTHPDVEAVISLCPQPSKQFYQGNGNIAQGDIDLSQAMAGVFAGFGARAAEYPTVPHILVGHFQVAGSRKSEKQILAGNDIEITRGQIELAQADLCCFGHIHMPQEVIPQGFYSGSIYAKDYGEIHSHGFYIHTLSKGELDSRPEYLSSEFIETPTRKYHQVKADMTGSEVPDDHMEDVAGRIVRLEFKTWQDEAGEIDREAIKKAYIDAGAESVEIRVFRVPRESVRSENIIHCRTLREKLAEMARLRGEEVPETILAKADILESEPAEKIILEVAA